MQNQRSRLSDAHGSMGLCVCVCVCCVVWVMKQEGRYFFKKETEFLSFHGVISNGQSVFKELKPVVKMAKCS